MSNESTLPDDRTDDGINRRNVLKTTGAAVLGSGLGLGGSVVGGQVAIGESPVGIAAGEDDPGVSPKAVSVDLIAGQNEDVGSVTVSEDGDDIEVTYSLEDGWLMTESHLHLATDCDDIPQTGSGNPKVGRFEFSREYDPAVGTDTYVVDQATQGFVDADTLCIAAHAVVFKDEDDDGAFDPNEREETAWGEGEQFEQKGKGRGNWAMHFDYEVCD